MRKDDWFLFAVAGVMLVAVALLHAILIYFEVPISSSEYMISP